MCAHLVRFLLVAFAVFFAGSLAAGAARADALGRYLVWSSVAHSGYQMRSAVNSFFDLQDQRALWRENVATAKAELERCGGCASAQRKLDYWQGTETTFNTFVGGATNEDMVAGFVASLEYYANPRKGNARPAAWVASAYRDVLFRDPQPGEVDGWLRALGVPA